MSEYDDQVSKLDRELRFFPIAEDHPRVLTREQIEFYNREGYLTGFTACGRYAADRNRAAFDSILQLFMKQGKDSYAIDRYHDRIPAIYDLAKHPVITDHVADLLGPSFVCWATHYFCKMPGDEKGVSWHQDCSYWPLTPSKTVTVWLAIDDVDRENGCMQVIPRSHLHGHLDWRESGADERNVLTQTIEGVERFGRPVDIGLKAGQFSIHSDLLIHGSLPNRSSRRRCGLTLRYCPTDVRAYWGWNEHGIVCRGSDPTGHWRSIPRPVEQGEFKP